MYENEEFEESRSGGDSPDLTNFKDYYARVNQLVDYADWDSSELLAELFSCRDKHALNPGLQIFEIDEDFPNRKVISHVFDDIIDHHCRILFYLSRREYEDAFKDQMSLLQLFNRELLSKEKDTNWFIPILYTLASDLRVISSMADKNREVIGEDEKSYYEEAATPIMESYRICVAEGRVAPEITKKVSILNLTNQLFRIYFRINRLHLLKPLIRSIDHSNDLKPYFSLPDLVTYNYFLGRKAIFDNDLNLADKSLSFAFTNCPSEITKNKRLILIYLVPVKMFLGRMPKQELLENYGLRCFYELVLAVKDGNVKRLEEVMTEQEDFFIDVGIFLMLEKLKMTTYLNLLKLVYKTLNNAAQIKLDAVIDILTNTGVEMDADELMCILGNLIVQKKLKGYISYVHKTIVLSKVDPFPNLPRTQTD